MRIDIKTKGKVKDNDIRAILLLQKAMEISSDKMRKANLDFIKSKWRL